MAESELSIQRAALISNILQIGLFPGKYLSNNKLPFFPSLDGVNGRNVNGVILEAGTSDEMTAQLGRGFYDGPYSVFPVVAERPGEQVLFWGDPEEILTHEEVVEANFKSLTRRMNACFLVVCKKEKGSFNQEEGVSPDDFTSLLIPRPVLEEVSPYLIQVDKAKVVSVGGSMDRRITLFKRNFSLPNVESVLIDLVTQHRRIWVHGVRLPVQEDL